MFASTSFFKSSKRVFSKEKNKKVYNQSLENLKSYLGNLNLDSINKINKNTKKKLVNIILKIKTEQNTKQKQKLLKRFYQSLQENVKTRNRKFKK